MVTNILNKIIITERHYQSVNIIMMRVQVLHTVALTSPYVSLCIAVVQCPYNETDDPAVFEVLPGVFESCPPGTEWNQTVCACVHGK